MMKCPYCGRDTKENPCEWCKAAVPEEKKPEPKTEKPKKDKE